MLSLNIDTFLQVMSYGDMQTEETKMERLRTLFKAKAVLHPRDLRIHGIPVRYLERLCKAGTIYRAGRGIYVASTVPDTMHLGMAQAAIAAPTGVVCLLSALRFHEIGTQMPHQVWIALGRGTAQPRSAPKSICFVSFSGTAYSEGITTHEIAGVPIKMYSPAKTVADCFKFRNKIGLDVAIEALKAALQSRICSIDELWHFASICRVTNVIRPYLESLV